MKVLTEENRQKVSDFLNNLHADIDITNYVNCEDLEVEDFENDMFEKILEVLNNNNGFEQEVIYYASAMDYLRENDNSLRESLQLAHDMGFETDKLSSEILASILKTENVTEEFYELKDDINTFFSELYDELETFTRICAVTGEEMNEGWHIDGSYFKYQKDADKFAQTIPNEENPEKGNYKDFEELYNSCEDSNFCYYTEWEDED